MIEDVKLNLLSFPLLLVTFVTQVRKEEIWPCILAAAHGHKSFTSKLVTECFALFVHTESNRNVTWNWGS